MAHKYDVHNMRTGEVNENLSFTEVSVLTGIPRNKVGKYVQAQHVKSGTYIVTYHGVTIEETANGDMSKYDDKTETKVNSYSPEFIKWFTAEWDNLPIVKLFRMRQEVNY
ncbi:hypothetical protein [Lachnoclostridium sp.]|uniref:hypothetical protein n=1 Tax=Lachnoclostridium sp. TaxID=2028282 RepID=UPI00289EF496|nr:hypothetical protein [Lachnoclostridium sp.]